MVFVYNSTRNSRFYLKHRLKNISKSKYRSKKRFSSTSSMEETRLKDEVKKVYSWISKIKNK